MRKGAICDLHQAVELIDGCEADREADQAELLELSRRLRKLAERLSTQAVLKVSEL